MKEETQPPLRQRLIDRSIDLLEQEGVAALTLRAAARAAGVSHMAPYRHFADKDALLAAVAETGFRELAAAMDRVAAGEPEPRKKLRAMGRAYLEFALRRPALYRLMFGPALAGRTGFAGLADAGRSAFDRCAQAVRASVPAERPTDEAQAAAVAVATWSLVHGLASLLIDGRIALPAEDGGREALIDRVLGVYGKVFE